MSAFLGPIRLLTLMLVVAAVSSNQVQSQRTGRCIVSDPTSTELNVRSAPQGAILFSLRNGYEVYIVRTARDHKNQPWALVKDWINDDMLGWVFREFISCY